MSSGNTLSAIRRAGEAYLAEAGIDDPAFDSMALLAHCFAVSREEYAMRGREEIPENDSAYREYLRALEKRAARIPLQYIIGRADFMGYSFLVTPDVLIPRFDSETLVAAASAEARPGMKVLDLCTGSGCLLLSLMKEVPGLTGTGCDLSGDALSVAGKNAEQLKTGPVLWYKGDLFEALPADTEPFDMIITNPPYIETEVIGTLSAEVRDHEPAMALDGGSDGLDFYRRILAEAGKWLTAGGLLFAEIGCDQAHKVSEFFENAGFTETSVLYDLGGNARVVRGRYGNIQ